MPIRLPATEKTPVTKKVTPNGLESDGPNEEYFLILDYLDAAVDIAARKSATTTITNPQGRLLSETVDNAKYSKALVNAQLKGWRTIVPPGMAFDALRMTEEDGNYFWQFTVQNMADLPEDIVLWLAGEIVSCGGVIPTASLMVTTEAGQVLDFRRPPNVVGSIAELEVPPAIGDPAVPAGSTGDSV
jgi:outer membrane protein assembly factor BamB